MLIGLHILKEYIWEGSLYAGVRGVLTGFYGIMQTFFKANLKVTKV